MQERQLVAELGALVRGVSAPPPPGGFDEERFVSLCERHQVVGAVARVPGTPHRPELARAHLEAFGRATVIEQRRDEVVGAAAAAGIGVIVVKGGDWAFRVYPDPGMRPMVDIDLLAPPGRAADVVQALQGAEYAIDPAEIGFLEGGYAVGMYPSLGPRVRVEVHPDLCRAARHPVDVAGLFERARPLAGGPGLRLDDVDGLLYCAIHHGLHGYRMPLLWLLDFALLAHRCGAAPEVADRARRWQATQVLATSRRLAEALWGELPLVDTSPARSPYLRALIRPDHLQMNVLNGDRAARIASAPALLEGGRLAYLLGSLARRITKK